MIYIGFYSQYKTQTNREVSVAAIDKMNYLLSTIPSDINVEIFSCSAVTDSSSMIIKSERHVIDARTTLRYPTSFCVNNKMLKYFNMLWISFALFFYLIRKTQKGETVLVYHSTGYFLSIILAKYLKRFKLLLEVEELYANCSHLLWHAKYIENKMIKISDAYIFASDTLNAILNKKEKPAIIVYGSYTVPSQVSEKFNDGLIHVIYAGTFDKLKGGAIASIKAASYLDSNYHLHICGFGTEEETRNVQSIINDINKNSKSRVTFEGLLKGADYISFLQKCDIGLSTQNPIGAYNDTSFPSKIISYMSNGLVVVSVNIKAVSTSTISPYISFYNSSTPEAIARAISEAPRNNDSRDVIKKLDSELRTRIKKVL